MINFGTITGTFYLLSNVQKLLDDIGATAHWRYDSKNEAMIITVWYVIENTHRQVNLGFSKHEMMAMHAGSRLREQIEMISRDIKAMQDDKETVAK